MAPPSSASAVGGVIDWRPHLSPPFHQGDTAMCASFAAAAAVEAAYVLKYGDGIELNPAYLHVCAMGLDPGQPANLGMLLDQAVDTGIAPGHADVATDPALCATLPHPQRITNYFRIRSAAAAAQALRLNEPVVATIDYYKDFKHFNGSGVYRRGPGATLIDAHVICLVGFDDTHQCWVVKNSLGPEWGDGGFCRFGYEECGIFTGANTAYALTL